MKSKTKKDNPRQHMAIFHVVPGEPVFYRVHYTVSPSKDEDFVRITAISADTEAGVGDRITRHEEPKTWAKCREVLVGRILQPRRKAGAS